MTDMIMKELRALGKEKKTLNKEELDKIKEKVKNKLLKEKKHDNQSARNGGSVLQPEEKLPDQHDHRERSNEKEAASRRGNDSPTGDAR
jgi:hypothetical protein